MVHLTKLIEQARVMLADAKLDCEVDEAGVALAKIKATIGLLDRALGSLAASRKGVDIKLPDSAIIVNDRMLSPKECKAAGRKISRPQAV